MTFTKESAKTAGSKGGKATRNRRGTTFFSQNGKKGMKSRWKEKGNSQKPVD